MTYDEKIAALRGAFAAALKYQWQDRTWQKQSETILRGGKIKLRIDGPAGDSFAYWYNQLHLPAEMEVYDRIKQEFFES